MVNALDFTATLGQMAGLRNRLVHVYWEVDAEQIYEFLQQRLGDFDRYARLMLQFIQSHP